MKQIIYNAQTKETQIIDIPDIEAPVIEPVHTPTLEELAETVSDLTTTLNEKGLIP
jgi:hypothetical protein